MAGQVRRGIVFGLACLATIATALAQTATPEPQTPRKGPGWNGNAPHEGGAGGAAFENVRRALDALTPEQRKRFQENFLRWANLSPEEKKSLRDREEQRKKVMEQETETALQESGLQLDSERREQFIKRYAEGRRQIEEQLRKEMNEKRKPMVHDLISRLRTEFASGAPAANPSQQTVQTISPNTGKP
jgi:DNA-directed RNA polymerase specialized sigma24 family protein